MKQLVISSYEISKAIRDVTLFIEIPEFRPIEGILRRYDEMAQTAPASNCCAGKSDGKTATQAMDQEMRKAVSSFIAISQSLSIESRAKLRKRYRTEELVLQYRDPINLTYQKKVI